jgi:hypothetical protein
MKVIYLAFANSASSPLQFLTEEDNEVYEILSDRYAIGDYFIHRESFANPETINKFLDKYKDDLAIFHFSGHAGKDKLLAGDQPVFSSGIAKQLKNCAEKGVLKLVVLNGCSTGEQVKMLKANGVPAIISTTAPIKDKSAMEFSKRLWKKLVQEETTIEEAYKNALTAAETVTAQDLSQAYSRHLFTDDDLPAGDGPLWRLDCESDEAIKSKPVPYKSVIGIVLPKPNEELIETLFNSFKDAGNPQVVDLWEKEQNGAPVTESAKQIAIVNSIPFPIGIHLQKLICPTSGTEDEGYDEFGLKRLGQIAQLFETIVEFFSIIMMAQIWEIFVRYPDKFTLGVDLKSKLKEYVELGNEEREVYDYIPLIKMIREFLWGLRQANIDNIELKEFIDEHELLKDLFLSDDNFRDSCTYLSNIRIRAMQERIDEDSAKRICYEAERQLCVFLAPLGFIHRYHLTSVQSIDILKFRHILKNNTEYKHRIIRCMQAIGTDEWSYYYMNTFLDNWGVSLLKCRTTILTRKGKKKRFKVEVLDYLNLSPFVIDRNSFLDKTDLAYIMFYRNETEKEICFKRVAKPLLEKDSFSIKKQEDEEDRFDAIRIQFNAFKEFIS